MDDKKKKLWASAKEIVIILISAFILASSIKFFLVDNRVIPTSSMVPTVPVDSRILINRVGSFFSEPEFQDIIVFEPTESTQAEVGLSDDMLKRVIGVEGDIIEVRDGVLYVNEVEISEDYIAEPMEYSFGPVEVPEDMLFVMGDNRNYSFDSHLWADPFVPVENVKGVAFMIYWPTSEFGMFE